AIPLILSAMEKIEQEDDWYALGPLGQYITAEHSDFDTRTYGHKKLSDLVKSLNEFETRKSGAQLHIRRRP
uniref:OST-HTH/LOTUS domain-containing protein n=1 Tax=Shimia sp. TaxID=1954381 RepID=UPI0035669AA5